MSHGASCKRFKAVRQIFLSPLSDEHLYSERVDLEIDNVRH